VGFYFGFAQEGDRDDSHEAGHASAEGQMHRGNIAERCACLPDKNGGYASSS